MNKCEYVNLDIEMHDSIVDSSDYKNFLRDLQSNKRRIFGFIYASVPHYSTAEDIMQDTIIRLWSKYSTLTPGTNFAAWGISYARYVIMEYKRKNQGVSVQFDSQVLDVMAESFISDNHMDNRVEALHDCLKKMPEPQQKIIRMRYIDNMTVKDIALTIGRPVHGMYKAMIKIQGSLQECIERILEKWDMI